MNIHSEINNAMDSLSLTSFDGQIESIRDLFPISLHTTELKAYIHWLASMLIHHIQIDIGFSC